MIVQVALPVPLRTLFDYTLPPALHVTPGMRVKVPFGRRSMVGIVVGETAVSAVPAGRLRAIQVVLDPEPIFPATLLDLLRWVADYYHHALGEVLAHALPVALRQGAAADLAGEERWALTDIGREELVARIRRAPLQRRLYAALALGELSATDLTALSPRWRPTFRNWQAQGWVRSRRVHEPLGVRAPASSPPALNAAQQAAVAAVVGNDARPYLLHGITGSGKTEVYLGIIEAALARDQQVLVLVPEIALTPQLLRRFTDRIAQPIAVLHSGLNETQRAQAWLRARAGAVSIVIGTRSAVFAPLPRLGAIIVDEEHDASYKQQDGLRYHARDVAVMRGHRAGVPVVLGSASPSLETFHNTLQGRFQRLSLPERAGSAALPQVHILDVRRLALADGLTHPLLQAMGERLRRGEQSLLFLNRRGFAPVLYCPQCRWVAPCARCDARLTVHKRSGRLRCHHCGADGPLITRCGGCGAGGLKEIGAGTQRIEEALTRAFPGARIVRVDSDSTARKGALEDKLELAHSGAADILVGTQILSKGHDFPRVTLVGVLNADQGLYGSDYRAAEVLFQQILQVAGRAGRAQTPGQVLVQTHHPEHPLFAALATHDYEAFARFALREREQAGYPPFGYFALMRAETPVLNAALKFLASARSVGARINAGDVALMDPVPAPMERRAGRFRAQLLVQARARRLLHRFVSEWLPQVEALASAKRTRWSLDIDPISLY